MGCPVKVPWGQCMVYYPRFKVLKGILVIAGVTCQLPFALGPGSGWGCIGMLHRKNPAVLRHPDCYEVCLSLIQNELH